MKLGSIPGFWTLLAAYVLAILPASAARAAPQPGQSFQRQQQSAPLSKPQKLDQTQAELQKRLERAQSAKASKEPSVVAHASELVIAFALREMAHVRLLESAYPQATELYGSSLNFENTPETRVDLAITQMQAGHVDLAIAEADRALLDDPNNLRAFQVLGRAWIAKNDFPKASHALARVAELSPNLENLYSLGLALLATKDAADRTRANQVFRQIITLTGDSGSLHVMFGRAYRDAGDLPAAMQEFKTAIKLDTRTPHAHYFLGLAYLATNEWSATPEVKTEFQKELEYFPRDYLANYMMGFIISAERKYEEANKYLRLATTLNREAPEPWLYLGLNAYAVEDMKSAEEFFRKAIDLTGSDVARSNFQIRRAYIDLGRILATSGRKEESEKYLEEARALQKKVMEATQQGMTSRFMEEGANSAASSAVFMPLPAEEKDLVLPAESAPVDPFAQVDPAVLAQAHLTEKQKSQAEAQERQLRTILAQSYSDLATSEAMRQLYSAALSHYEEAEHWDAALPGLMRSLGTAAFRAQDYSAAVRGLSAALNANPNDPPVRAMLGLAYFDEEKYPAAVKAFTPLGKRGMQDTGAGYAWAASLAKMGEMLPASQVLKEFEQPERPPETQMLIGQLWIEIGDYARAVASFQRVWERAPGTPKAHYFAGQAYLHWQHWNEAAKEFQAELLLSPDDADAKFSLGFVYLQQSKKPEAEALFREVIANHPEHGNAQYEFGKILLERGEINEALVHLERAARLNPQLDFVHYQLQAAYRKEGRVAEADRELEIYKELKARKRKQASDAIPSASP